VAQKAVERATRAEQNAALKARRRQENLHRQGAGERPRKKKRETKPLTRLFSIERPGRMLAVACASLMVLLVAEPLSNSSRPFPNGGLAWLDLRPADAEAGILFVQRSTVNVRERASQESSVVAHIKQSVAVVEVARQGAWVQVIVPETNGAQGWVHSSLLAAQPPVQQSP
jgi:hypothetical protein